VDNFLSLVRRKPDTRGAFAPAFIGGSAASFPALRACSNCAGDYEDPERTAWTPGAEGDEDAGQEVPPDAGQNDDELPAKEM
jgi:hypothetical protein